MGLSHDSGDCSDRICPYEIAWVDSPNKVGIFHKYAECAGRGVCDRTTGECQCFDGYEGKACARQSCPNACSGHGTCEWIDELGYKSTSGEYSSSLGTADMVTPVELSYFGWDARKSRACVCDAQYYDVDCSKRMCPYGNDVLDVRDDLLVGLKYQTQRLQFVFNQNIPTATGTPQTFALTFKSKLNETFTTIPIVFDPLAVNGLSKFSNAVQMALLGLPNKVIDGVSVAASIVGTVGPNGASFLDMSGATVLVNVTFTGNSVQGPQHPLGIEAYECFHGCTPKITGLDLQTRYGWGQSNETEVRLADYNSYECGRRGKCDYTSGLCECFNGYGGDNCNMLVSLI